MEFLSLAILFIVTLLSSIMGGMIGGALLIIFPTMVFLGLPVHAAIATSRFAIIGSAIGSFGNYYRLQRVNLRVALPFAVTAVLGSFIGANITVNLSENILKNIIAAFMVITGFVILAEDKLGIKEKRVKVTKKTYFLSSAAGLLLGIYGGIFGGGMGALLVFALVSLLGLGFTNAVANSKPVTLSVTLMAAGVFIYKGMVDYSVGVPLLLASFIGAIIGSQLAVKLGNIWVRRAFLGLVIVLALRLMVF